MKDLKKFKPNEKKFRHISIRIKESQYKSIKKKELSITKLFDETLKSVGIN